jgi:POT family proton-dependent oligopeptide transporter
MLPLLALFWVAQAQIWNTYPIWVRDHVDLMVGGWRVPVPWFQAIDALSSVVVVPPVMWFWRRQAARSREPDELMKIALGCIIFGAAVLWLAASGTAAFGKVPVLWAVAFHLLSSVGWVYFGPTAVAIFSRAAPTAVNAMMMGVYNLSVFGGGIVAGRIGGLYERLSTEDFWLLHAMLIGIGGVGFLLLRPQLRRALG